MCAAPLATYLLRLGAPQFCIFLLNLFCASVKQALDSLVSIMTRNLTIGGVKIEWGHMIALLTLTVVISTSFSLFILSPLTSLLVCTLPLLSNIVTLGPGGYLRASFLLLLHLSVIVDRVPVLLVA